MKVLYVAHTVEPSGATTALQNVMAFMLEQKHNVHLVVNENKGDIVDWAYNNNITVHVCKSKFKSFYVYPNYHIGTIGLLRYIIGLCRRRFVWMAEFYSILKKVEPDIVHCNTSVIDYALIPCKLLRIPHVWHIREYPSDDCQIKPFPSLGILKWKMHMRNNYNIAITKGIFDFLDMNSKDRVIYDGVFPQGYSPETIIASDFPYRYFLFVGTIHRGKGLHVLLSQFVKFTRINKCMHLNVAATIKEADPYFKYCMDLVRNAGVSDRVHFLGYRTDVYSLMKGAVALVVPSILEPFGFITVEGMVNKCLVIGHDTGGTKEQFDMGKEQYGEPIALRYSDESELCDLMQKACTCDFEHMKEIAYETVVSRYSLEKSGGYVLNYYNDIIKNYGSKV